MAQGDTQAALESYRAALAIAERLAKQDPTNAEWQRDLSVSHGKLGDVFESMADRNAATAEYRAGLAIALHLAKQDPTNAIKANDVKLFRARLEAGRSP